MGKSFKDDHWHEPDEMWEEEQRKKKRRKREIVEEPIIRHELDRDSLVKFEK